MTRSPYRRHGFSLVEILVTVAIIATLAAVAVGALFRIRTATERTNTESTMQKIDGKLLQKLKNITEFARDPRNKGNAQYQAALATGGSDDIAQAILIYLKTKNELPMSFNEAKAAVTFGSLTLQPSPIFASLPASAIPAPVPEESAVCLYLAIAPLGLDGLEEQVGEIPSGQFAGRKCFLDRYGQPICFNRLAYGGDGTELDGPPYVKAPIAANTFDPFYPKQVNGVYRNLTTDYGANTTALWNVVITNVPAWANVPAVYPGLRNHEMTVLSGGLNKVLLEPTGLFTADNITSYRLRKEGQRGD